MFLSSKLRIILTSFNIRLENKIIFLIFLKLVYLKPIMQNYNNIDIYDVEIDNRILPKIFLFLNNTHVVNCSISNFKNNKNKIYNLILIQLDNKNSSLKNRDLNNENSIELAIAYSYMYSRLNFTALATLYPLISFSPMLFLNNNSNHILIKYFLITIYEMKKFEIKQIKINKKSTTSSSTDKFLNSEKKSDFEVKNFGVIMYIVVVILCYAIFGLLVLILRVKKSFGNDEVSAENEKNTFQFYSLKF